MPKLRRVLFWVVPLAGLLLVGLAVLWLRDEPLDDELPGPLLPPVAAPVEPDLPEPSGPTETRPPAVRPTPISGGLTGRLVTPDFRPVKGQGRIEAVRGANLGIPGLGTAAKLGISGALDGEGRFTLERLPVTEDLVLQLEGESFAMSEAGPFRVEAGNTRDVGDLMVQLGTNIVVSVLDPHGRPVEGAQVSLFQIADEPTLDMPPHSETVTDAHGVARFMHARSAVFTVRAQAEGLALAQLQTGPIYPDAPTEFAVVLNLVEALPIEGLVLGEPGGLPLAGAQVDAVPIDPGNGGGRTTTGEDGRFSIPNIAPGNYTVAARAQGYSAHSERTWAGQGPTEVELHLQRQGTLRGRIVGDDGAPIRAFDLQPRSHKRRLDPAFPRQSLLRIVDAQGEFVLENLDPGFWCLEAWAQGYALTESPCVRVRQGQDVVGVVVQLVRGATLTGAVFDDTGAPVVGARVSLHMNLEPDAEFLRDTEPSAALGGEARTDAQGRFALHDLAARAFQVEVDHPDFAIVRRNDVQTEAGQALEAAPFVLTRSGSVSGKALSALGDPLSGVTVHLYRVGDWSRQTVSDGQGVFRFERLPGGDYELSCYGRNPDFGAMLSAVAGPNKPLPFKVEKGQHVVHDTVAIE